jgi:hypothetical protein
MLRCRMPIGKAGVGSVVIHKRKSSCGLWSCSRIFSNVFSHEGSRWQFCNKIH